MTFQAGFMLARLAGAGIGAIARAVGLGPSQAQPQQTQPGAANADFAALLKRAGVGALASGKPVHVNAQTDTEFTPDQLQRLSLAADRAEAAGLNTALVLIDGQAFEMDVATRTITGRFDPTQTRAQVYDGVISAPGENDAAPAPMLPMPQANTAANPRLNALLAEMARQSRSAQAGQAGAANSNAA